MKKHILLAILFIINIWNGYSVLTPLIDSIKMIDGKKLAVDIYIPNGMGSGPVILIQTPYNRQVYRLAGLPLGIGPNINSSNYIFVVADWRGFYGSKKATYVGNPDRTRDGYSTVEWIAAQTWSNGKIGTWGASALGKVQYQTAKGNPPHLTCICPVVAAPQFEYNEYFPNGALKTEYVQQLDGLGFGLTQGLMAHPVKDNFWNFVEDANDYPDSIQVPCFMIGGWYDHNTQLMMDFYTQLIARSPANVKGKHKILMGPWVHGGHSTAKVGSTTQGQLSYPNAQNKNDSMAIQFFDYYLRNINNNWNSVPAYTLYQMGENKWLNEATWPLNGVKNYRFYLNKNGLMDPSAPNRSSDSINYIYDPTDPSPTIGGCTLRSDLLQGPYDQSNGVENRADALVFSSDIITKDLVLNGRIKVVLKVSSSQLDTDFDVRVTDVYPDGKSMLLNDGVMRMRFRNGFTQAQVSMMVPGIVYDCVIELPTTCITFLSGHRIRLIISSSNYPKYNRNMNNGQLMYPGNSVDSLLNPLSSINTIYCNSLTASYVELPLLNFSSNITSLKENKTGIIIYPNPVGNKLKVSFLANLNLPNTMHLFNQIGQEVMQILPTSNEFEIDLSTLKCGIYTLGYFENGNWKVESFVKEN
jgi:predicted acyl esterase